MHSVHTVTLNCFIQAADLGNKARELKGLIDDSESVIFINLDRYTHILDIQYVYIQYVHSYFLDMVIIRSVSGAAFLKLNVQSPLFINKIK